MNEKPLCFLDLETTGTDPVKDRIVSIAAVTNEGGSDVWYEQHINPGIPIPAEVTAIHGITDAMVADKPRFKAVSNSVRTFIDGCDLSGYNLVNFDLPMLWEEFNRCGIKLDLTGVNIIDPCVIFREMEPRDLTAAMKFYCNASHDGAHGARADVDATRRVLLSQYERYESIAVMSRGELSKFSTGNRVDLAGTIELKDGIPCYTAKRVRGVPVKQDPGFGSWMLRNDFSEETKMHLRRILGVK